MVFWPGKLGRRQKGASPATEEELRQVLDMAHLPVHVAIIMDGNGRWATRRGLPRALGHRTGVESLRDIVRLCVELKLGFLTVYAFSTENWKRPLEEVNILMDLLVEYLRRDIDELCENNVNINPIGRLHELPMSAREALRIARERSSSNSGLVFNVALNYGGRTELVEAFRSIATEVQEGRLKVEEINEVTVSNHIYTAGQPDPDLLIRPAGELRISNFLLWQLAYAEFWLTPVMWPEFRRQHLLQALVDYQNRERRFGGLLHS